MLADLLALEENGSLCYYSAQAWYNVVWTRGYSVNY
jgi:hypothetical protein